MGNIFHTTLECLSNGQFFQNNPPMDILRGIMSEDVIYKNGIYFFETDHRAPIYEIKEFSKKHPAEVFTAEICDFDLFNAVSRKFRFKAGKAKIIREEPNYQYTNTNIHHVMNKEIFQRLMKTAMTYIRQLDPIQKNPDIKNIENQDHNDKIHTNVTIHVENDKFKLEVTRLTYSCIKVDGYVKETPKPVWNLIQPTKSPIVSNDQKPDPDIN
jgi:hypothetical protein